MSAAAPSPIYHACARDAWEAARAEGVYRGSPQDRADGFIHFSSAAQLVGSLASHHAGRPDLVLLTVDPAPLGEALKWEPSRSGRLFPHLYAPLPVAAVLRADPLPLDADGRHRLPPHPG